MSSFQFFWFCPKDIWNQNNFFFWTTNFKEHQIREVKKNERCFDFNEIFWQRKKAHIFEKKVFQNAFNAWRTAKNNFLLKVVRGFFGDENKKKTEENIFIFTSVCIYMFVCVRDFFLSFDPFFLLECNKYNFF